MADKLSAWFQALKRNFSDLPRFESEIEHLRAWQEHVREFAPKLASRLVWLQAYPPFHRGGYRDSYSRLEQARTLLEPAQDNDLELKANLLTDLCTINCILGQYPQARKCGEEAIAIRVKLFGENNSDTAMSFHNTGATLRAMGENDKALEYHQKAVSIWQGLHGEHHIDTALALEGVSVTYRALNKNKEALEFAERALSIREKVLGESHPDTASSFSGIGNIYAALGDNSRALQYEEKALSIANELFGARSPIKASALKNVAFAYFGQKNFKKALEAALESLTVRKELFGDQHPETLVTVVDVAAIFFEMGRVHQGFQLLDDYLRKITKGHSHYGYLKGKKRDFESRFVRPGFRQRPR